MSASIHCYECTKFLTVIFKLITRIAVPQFHSQMRGLSIKFSACTYPQPARGKVIKNCQHLRCRFAPAMLIDYKRSEPAAFLGRGDYIHGKKRQIVRNGESQSLRRN